MVFAGLALDTYDLDLLDDYLGSLEHDDEVMMLSELDGYLTAVAIAPHTIMPGEWLPEIWAGDAPSFTDTVQANAVYGSIMGLYNDNLRMLADETIPFEPLFMPDLDGSPFVDLWAGGFMRGVGLRGADWQPLLDDEEARGWLSPIAVLAVRPGEPGYDDLTLKERERLGRRIPRHIPEHVSHLRAFWRKRGLGPAGALPPRPGPSPKSL